jgi:hypothetical protein
MFKPKLVEGDKKPMSSGPFMLLKSIMGQEAVDNIQRLAGNGTFEKIVKFVDDIEQHNKLLQEQNELLKELLGRKSNAEIH